MFIENFIYKQNLIDIAFVVIFLIILTSRFVVRFNKKTLFLFNTLVLSANFIYILYTTIFSRNIGDYKTVFIPFIFLIEAQNQPELYRTFFMNCLLFVPLGICMPYVLSKKRHIRNVYITIAFAAVLSATIEFLQYYFRLGRCETDDVIANTFGAAVGTLSYLLYMHILKNHEKRSLMYNKISNNQKLLMNLCAKSLFGKECNLPDDFDCSELIEEAKRQTVLSLVFGFVRDKADNNFDKLFSQIVAKNIRVEYGHNEVHKALNGTDIPYVILKGVSSASYYKEPMLRMMGDIDILVSPQNIDIADKALKSIGFVTDDKLDKDDHIAYRRRDGLICELHREINGIPKNEAGDIAKKYFADVFEKAVCYDTSNGSCIVPNVFHHGLILLLHTANHLTKEGIGLRHLCDWAVFVNSLPNDDFVDVFEKPLKEIGLWRFAQLITLCSVKYLGCDKKTWAGETTEFLLDEIIADILNGGNFGIKDQERYNQIKYISDRKSGNLGKKNLVLQLLFSINEKTKNEFKFTSKFKLLLPIGWVFTIVKYLYLVVIGKRSIDGVSTIKDAEARKNIYNEFKLFDKE